MHLSFGPKNKTFNAGLDIFQLKASFVLFHSVLWIICINVDFLENNFLKPSTFY